MALQAVKGPFNVFGVATPSPTPTSGIGVAQDYNSDRSPSLFDMGIALADPRYPYSTQPGGASATQGTRGGYGWLGVNEIVLVDQVPSTISAVAIAAAQVPVAGTALTLALATAAGITVGVSITSATTGRSVTSLLAIDGAMTPIQTGSSGGNLLWDPTKALARAVQITSVGNDSAATFLVSGYDVYSYPMSERITGSNGGVATGTKAFKYIASIVPAGTLSGSNVSVGQADKIGFLMRVDRFQYIQIYWPDTTLISATTGFTGAVTTSPATTLTGDVRGTYALQAASNNAQRLIMTARITASNISSATGLVGVTQV